MWNFDLFGCALVWKTVHDLKDKVWSGKIQSHGMLREENFIKFKNSTHKILFWKMHLEGRYRTTVINWFLYLWKSKPWNHSYELDRKYCNLFWIMWWKFWEIRIEARDQETTFAMNTTLSKTRWWKFITMGIIIGERFAKELRNSNMVIWILLESSLALSVLSLSILHFFAGLCAPEPG